MPQTAFDAHGQRSGATNGLFVAIAGIFPTQGDILVTFFPAVLLEVFDVAAYSYGYYFALGSLVVEPSITLRAVRRLQEFQGFEFFHEFVLE